MMNNDMRPFPAAAFAKNDPSDDAAFYGQPRLVNHIDTEAIAALSAFYCTHLPSTGRILDLMSSWVSHLPSTIKGDVVGHGMNAAELAANPRLQDWFVRNLNVQPMLPYDDNSFVAAVCCVGVQYLQQPDSVFADIARVLRPGAPYIVSFSNRCFPSKAITIWRALDGRGHSKLVALYL
jgi:SAM-dependent methyltransferase